MEGTFGKEIGREEIKNIIPHRDPFLFLDRIKVDQTGLKAVGYKELTGKEDFFRGHFPGYPIMPGVLMVESLAQSACVLFLSRTDLKDKLAYFLSIEEAKFRKPAFPGDTLELNIEVLRARGRSGKVRGEIYVKGELIAEAVFMFFIVDRPNNKTEKTQ